MQFLLKKMINNKLGFMSINWKKNFFPTLDTSKNPAIKTKQHKCTFHLLIGPTTTPGLICRDPTLRTHLRRCEELDLGLPIALAKEMFWGFPKMVSFPKQFPWVFFLLKIGLFWGVKWGYIPPFEEASIWFGVRP